MRITITHNQSRQEVRRKVDESVDEMLKGVPIPGFRIVNERRQWNGDTLDFAFTAKVGLMSSPLSGKVIVGEKDLTVDIDLPPFLSRLLPEEKMKTAITGKVRGLLQGS